MHCYVTVSNVRILNNVYEDMQAVVNQEPVGQLQGI